MAEIYTLTGDHDKAIDELEHLLSIPSPVSKSWINNNTIFRPLKNNPRYQDLIN